MKTDNSLILCDERIAGIKEEMAQFKNMEQAAKDAQSKLKQLLIGHYIEKAKEDLLKGIEFGDKVRVTAEAGWSNDKVAVEEGFLNVIYIDHYYTTDHLKDYVRISFNKMKKDGTPSLRTFDYSVARILKIEKV